jgi:hypothetical protein
MSDSAHDPQRITGYLRTRHEYLSKCRIHIENTLSDESREFIDSEDDEDTVNRFLLHIDGVVAITFRYSMLISACSYLEEALKLLCRDSISDYRSKLKAIKEGSWLSRHRSLLEDEPSVDIVGVEEHWDTMADFVLIRNCITHGWGNVNECRNSKRVQEIAAREDMYAVSKDGYLLLNNEAVTCALLASKQIVGKLVEELFGLSRHSI